MVLDAAACAHSNIGESNDIAMLSMRVVGRTASGQSGGGLGRRGWCDGNFFSPRGTINPQGLAEIGNGDVLGNVQTEDSPENAKPKQPEIERDAGDQSQECRHRQSRW